MPSCMIVVINKTTFMRPKPAIADCCMILSRKSVRLRQATEGINQHHEFLLQMVDDHIGAYPAAKGGVAPSSWPL